MASDKQGDFVYTATHLAGTLASINIHTKERRSFRCPIGIGPAVLVRSTTAQRGTNLWSTTIAKVQSGTNHMDAVRLRPAGPSRDTFGAGAPGPAVASRRSLFTRRKVGVLTPRYRCNIAALQSAGDSVRKLCRMGRAIYAHSLRVIRKPTTQQRGLMMGFAKKNAREELAFFALLPSYVRAPAYDVPSSDACSNRGIHRVVEGSLQFAQIHRAPSHPAKTQSIGMLEPAPAPALVTPRPAQLLAQAGCAAG